MPMLKHEVTKYKTILLPNLPCFLKIHISVLKSPSFPSSPVKFWIGIVYVIVFLKIRNTDQLEQCSFPIGWSMSCLAYSFNFNLHASFSILCSRTRESKSSKKKYTMWCLLKLHTSLTGEFWFTAGCAYVAYGHF